MQSAICLAQGRFKFSSSSGVLKVSEAPSAIICTSAGYGNTYVLLDARLPEHQLHLVRLYMALVGEMIKSNYHWPRALTDLI